MSALTQVNDSASFTDSQPSTFVSSSLPSDTSTISKDAEQGVGSTIYSIMRSGGRTLDSLVDKLYSLRAAKSSRTIAGVEYSVFDSRLQGAGTITTVEYRSPRLVIMGDGGTGKTAILKRYLQPTELAQNAHEGPECDDLDGEKWHHHTHYNTFIKQKREVDIIDTGDGSTVLQDRWVHLGDAFIIVFAVDSSASIDTAASLLERIHETKTNSPETPPITIVANKVDLLANPQKSSLLRTAGAAKIESLAQILGCRISRASAETRYGVDEVFNRTLDAFTTKSQFMRTRSWPKPARYVPLNEAEVTVSKIFTTSSPDELAINECEKLTILAEYDDGWALCRNRHGRHGKVPQRCYFRDTLDGLPIPPVLMPAMMHPKGTKVTVIYTFVPTLPDELSITWNDELNIIAEYDDGWALCKTVNGEQGMVPQECYREGETYGRPLSVQAEDI